MSTEEELWHQEGERIRALIQEFVYVWHREDVMECSVETQNMIHFQGQWMRHVLLCLRFVPKEYPYDTWRLFMLRTVIIDYLKAFQLKHPIRLQIPPTYIPMPIDYPEDSNKFFT